MKKIYLTLILLTVFGFIKAQVPTCSLDPTFLALPKKGVWPDSVTNFISGSVGVPYEQNITVKVPLDTIQASLKFCFNRVVLSTPTVVTNYNLPPGLNFASSTSTVLNGTVNGAPSFLFPGNANNCASIYGTPTAAGVYTLQLKTETFASLQVIGNCPVSPNISGGTNLNTSTLTYYIITILPPAGVNEEINTNTFSLRNIPNPFNSNTTIKFNVLDVQPFSFNVYDVLGNLIYSENGKTNIGENNITFNGAKHASGVYFYTLNYKNYSETKRMILTTN